MEFLKPATDKEQELFDILHNMWNDVEFVNGVLSFLKTDDERQDMIDAIDCGDVKGPSDIVLFASDIDDDREGTAQ